MAGAWWRCIDERHGGRAGDLWRWRVAMSVSRPRDVVFAVSGH